MPFGLRNWNGPREPRSSSERKANIDQPRCVYASQSSEVITSRARWAAIGTVGSGTLPAMPETVDFTAVAFGWAAWPCRLEMRPGFASFSQFFTNLAARFGLPVEGSGDWRGAAHFAESQNFHFKLAAVVLDFQEIAHSNFTRRLGWLTIEFNPAEFTGSSSQRACLEESGSPEPFV
jgi:hypothetical protein